MRGFEYLTLAAGVLLADYTQNQPPAPPVTTAEKWQFFEQETFTPFTLLAGGFNASVSQAMNADPRYGVGPVAYAKRFGAATTDNVSQNFFSDFVMASALHEDTRYRGRGPRHGF